MDNERHAIEGSEKGQKPETRQVLSEAPGYVFDTDCKPDTLTITPNGEEVIRIDADGNIFWKGREVTTDEDFKKSMLDLADCFMGKYKAT